MKHAPVAANVGAVVSVHGSVVDLRFDGRLPPIHSVLHAGGDGQIVIEVPAQRDAPHVRGVALTPTQGLARGMSVVDTGRPLKARVGEGVPARMLDVFGSALDRGGALQDVEWRSVHRAPPPLARRSTKSEIFETGIKAIDVPLPLERGGKAGLFGGAGVGKTVLLTEVIHNMIGHQGCAPFAWRQVRRSPAAERTGLLRRASSDSPPDLQPAPRECSVRRISDAQRPSLSDENRRARSNLGCLISRPPPAHNFSRFDGWRRIGGSDV